MRESRGCHQASLRGTRRETGFNAERRQLEDLSSAGVLDSAKALSDALGLALAYATGILKTAAWDTTPIAETDSSSR